MTDPTKPPPPTTMPFHQPISIIGAGLSGLSLARTLHNHRIPFEIYEKAAKRPRHNYGITLHASTYRPLLKILNLTETNFKQRVAVDAGVDGTGVIDPKALVSFRERGISQESFRANCGKLESLLREDLENERGMGVKWGTTIEKMHQEGSTGSGMGMGSKDGKGLKRLESSCIVVANGVHSSVRKPPKLDILPFVAFNGKRSVKRSAFDSGYATAMQNSTVVELKRGDVLLNISINEATKEEVSVSWVYSRPAGGSSDPLHKPNRPNSAAQDIPDEFFAEVGALTDLPNPFKDVFDAEKLKEERVLHWLQRKSMVGLQELKEAGGHGIFMIGDSVHAQPILGGDGANTAITDGMELGECIANSGAKGSFDRKVIPEWYEARYDAWEAGVRKSDKTIAEMHSEHKSNL
jgi:2-polyprenyl-6-methoxyphenol hydroxylase-like FAD-dependent oxidoreductase